jgi:predicted neuraminidase
VPFHTEPVFTENPGHPSCHASTIEELPDGTLLCAWYAGSYEKHPDVLIQMARKAPGEGEWSEPEVIQDTPGYSEGNPVLFHAPDDTLWLFYVTMYGNRWDECRLNYRQSRDAGRTWGGERVLHEPLGWMTKNKPTLHDGAILLPLYDEVNWRSMVMVSEDLGETWAVSNFVTSPPGNLQPTLMPLRDGRILMLLRTTGDSRVCWKSTSSDGGRTWADPAAPTDLPNPHSGTDGVTLRSGNLAYAYNPSPDARSPLSVALSEDDGTTWPCRKDLETEAAEFSYPSIMQGRNGRIHLVYTHRRTRIQHAEFDEEWLMGNDEA